uniref:Uncharacterized protein n=1 Tax=Arundo donax TaxID=35708 RepID=A0A0A9APH1_ARUDO
MLDRLGQLGLSCKPIVRNIDALYQLKQVERAFGTLYTEAPNTLPSA